MNTPLLPERVLFLARSEESVRMDLSSLRRIGIASVAFLTSKVKAIAALAELEKRRHAIAGAVFPDIILCDERLTDGDSLSVLSALAQQPNLRSMPVLVFASSSAAAEALRAKGVLALERPYAPQQLLSHLHAAMTPGRPPLDAARFVAEREKAPQPAASPTQQPPKNSKETMTTSDWCKLGVQRLQVNDLTGAEKAFQNALIRQDDNIDACLGLACLHQRKDNIPGMHSSLLRAAASATRQNDYLRANAIREKLPVKYQNGNIFTHEGLHFLEEGAFRTAALAFLDAARIESERPLHSVLARACQFTPNPEQSLHNLCEAYERMGQHTIARSVRQRLLNAQSAPPPVPPPSWLDNFPLMRDMIAVASFTASAWRQAE